MGKHMKEKAFLNTVCQEQDENINVLVNQKTWFKSKKANIWKGFVE